MFMARKTFDIAPRNRQEVIVMKHPNDAGGLRGITIDKFYSDPGDPDAEKPHASIYLDADQLAWLKWYLADSL